MRLVTLDFTVTRLLTRSVGPYDELMLIPGAFDVPGQNKKRLRITRIYVSQKDTMYNGKCCDDCFSASLLSSQVSIFWLHFLQASM